MLANILWVNSGTWYSDLLVFACYLGVIFGLPYTLYCMVRDQLRYAFDIVPTEELLAAQVALIEGLEAGSLWDRIWLPLARYVYRRAKTRYDEEHSLT